jgi:UDP-GlcNAc3NAcA epimerase
MKVVTIIGARPQFIKAAAVSRAILDTCAGAIEEVIVHTGQHFDDNMSQVFFDELDIPQPAYNLEIAGGSHGAMTGRMLAAVETVLVEQQPDWVLIYGDTNSTLAGALAAAKLHMPVAHVESGLRSFNMRMPEEINRILADRLSALLLCPTHQAVANLKNEGIVTGVHQVGDVMYDVALYCKERSRARSGIMSQLGLREGGYFLATCHRAENTDDPLRLSAIITALADLTQYMPVVFPIHPRTRKLLVEHDLSNQLEKLIVLDPQPFLTMIALEQAAKVILTDSGGVQKEAYFFGVPCVTMRDETEWIETLAQGWNRLAGANAQTITASALSAAGMTGSPEQVYGEGNAARKVVELLLGGQRRS